MSDIAIQVEDLSKRYRIGMREEASDTFVGAVSNIMARPVKNFRRLRSLSTFSKNGHHEEDIIWALRDVSFEVTQGEVLGIIGRNGAGKSTLLKVLTRITDPTSGRATLHGRVGSLLEVGTGFHPELTGRENVYLNGTILGMTKKEIDRKFDEIVDFSGVEKFIDTPVKRYSTGMRVRLAFAVAAYLDPEILIIDEVLAVGDAEFQRKCLGKMSDVASGGRTVLFVSHNMSAIARLCGRVMWLEGGKIRLLGQPSSVINAYLSTGSLSNTAWTNANCGGEDTDNRISSVRILRDNGEPAEVVDFGSSFKIEIAYVLPKSVWDLSISCTLTDAQGNVIWTSVDTDTTEWKGRPRPPGRYLSICTVPSRIHRPGRYSISVGAYARGKAVAERHENVLTTDISEVGYDLGQRRVGLITPLLEWTVQHGNCRGEFQ